GWDVLDLTSVTAGLTVSFCGTTPGFGTVSDGTSTATFTEIEHIRLSGGNNTVILSGDMGSITFSGFLAPVANPDGSFTTRDRFDLCNLVNLAGLPVTVDDIVITDTTGDGTGSPVIELPGG